MSAPSPVAVSTVETTSTFGLDGSLVSGSRKPQAAMPSAAVGMLIRKTEPHQKWLSRKPPTSGPSGMPSAEAVEIRATALPRSAGPNIAGSTDSDRGMISAAPTPRTTRAAITAFTSPAREPSAEPARKTASPAISMRRRPNRSPNRSPSRPAGSISAAKTTTYASLIRCCRPVVAPSCAAMVGRATLRIVESKASTSMLATRAPRAHQRRGSCRVAPSAGVTVAVK